jgi:hypothetical protein
VSPIKKESLLCREHNQYYWSDQECPTCRGIRLGAKAGREAAAKIPAKPDPLKASDLVAGDVLEVCGLKWEVTLITKKYFHFSIHAPRGTFRLVEYGHLPLYAVNTMLDSGAKVIRKEGSEG